MYAKLNSSLVYNIKLWCSCLPGGHKRDFQTIRATRGRSDVTLWWWVIKLIAAKAMKDSGMYQ